MDTLALHEQWDLNLGTRFDNYHVRDAAQSNRSNIWTYQAGLVFKPLPYASLYLSYGTSFNPSGETAGQSGGADGAAGGRLSNLIRKRAAASNWAPSGTCSMNAWP